MRTFSCCFIIFLVSPSPKTPVIYSLKFLVFNFLSIDFLATIGCHHCENQSALGAGV